MDYRQLGNTDMHVSQLSFGASALGAVFGKIDNSEGIKTVHAAIDNGINYLDVSPFYGDTVAESVLGEALKTIPRDKYYLATKTGRFAKGNFDFSAKAIEKSLHESLNRLGVEYLDVLQLHDIEYQQGKHLDIIVNESIPFLHELKEKGLIRYAGITSYPIEVFKHVHQHAQVDIMLCHSHYMLNDTSMLDLLPMAKQDGVGLIAASPLGMGLLTERGVADWHPATDNDKAIVQKAASFCKKNGTSIEKLALQFGCANTDIPTNLVSTSKTHRIIDNIKVVEEKMDEELVKEVQKILHPIKNKDFDFAKNCELM
ncbi:aldo/keto reductase [Labilibacter marinus]|uniref:aldo/keto reductase n=1 Tax=Labilibacter marinus TaxID=1477105 RepID=UPI00082AFE59|nr:aldo/keto reductase [Labilibacter marinus]